MNSREQFFSEGVVGHWHGCPGSSGVTVHGGVRSHGDVALGDVVGGHGGVGWSWVGDHRCLSQPEWCYDSHCGLLGSVSSYHSCAGRAVVQQKGFLLHVLAPLMQHIGLHPAAHGALEQAVRLLHGVLVTAWLDPNKCHFSWCLVGG